MLCTVVLCCVALGWVGLGWVELCCIVLCCVVLCCSVLCCVVLCCVVLHWTELGCVWLGWTGLCYVVLCCVVLCFVPELPCVVLRCVVFCGVVFCYVVLYSVWRCVREHATYGAWGTACPSGRRGSERLCEVPARSVTLNIIIKETLRNAKTGKTSKRPKTPGQTCKVHACAHTRQEGRVKSYSSVHRHPWISIALNEVLWTSLGIHGCPWKPMVIPTYPCMSMDI